MRKIDTEAHPPSRWQAAKDLSWFPILFSTLVGTPSILFILESITEFRLSAFFRWIIDGYNQLSRALAALVEPILLPGIELLNRAFDIQLDLHSHWRPIFFLGLVLSMGYLRPQWSQTISYDEDILHDVRRNGALAALSIIFLMSALIGSALSGLLPSTDSLLIQGAIGAIPVIVFWLIVGSAASLHHPLADFSFIDRSFSSNFRRAILLGAAVFFIGACLSIVFPSGGGVAAYAVYVFLVGCFFLLGSMSGQTVHSLWLRMALTILGGFIAAGVIFVADVLVRFLM